MSKLEVFVLVAALLNITVVVEFVRRRKLLEGFALLWLAVGVGGVVIGLGRPLVDAAARTVGISGPSLVFTAAFLFLVFVSMSLTLHVSRLDSRIEVLAEEAALLRQRLERVSSHDVDT
jgi:hypothetical protein